MTTLNPHRFKLPGIIIPAVLIVIILSSLPVLSEDVTENIAAGLRVMYAGVEIRLANTERWLPLAPESEMPFGAADMLRTDETGRAILTFDDQGEMLILPSSTVELLAYTRTTDKNQQLSIRLDGHAIQRVAHNSTIESFRLESEVVTVIQAAEFFGVWAIPETDPVVVVADGEATISTAEGEFPVAAGEGLRVTDAALTTVTSLNPPLNAAQLIGKLDGCPGKTQTTDKRGVNVRIGPGFDYSVVGSIPRERAVQVMAVSELGDWYRIQAYSGFGWMQVPLVVSTCENLPVLAGIIVEHNSGVWNATPEELTLLEPFYGPPGEDLWFYKGTRIEN